MTRIAGSFPLVSKDSPSRVSSTVAEIRYQSRVGDGGCVAVRTWGVGSESTPKLAFAAAAVASVSAAAKNATRALVLVRISCMWRVFAGAVCSRIG